MTVDYIEDYNFLYIFETQKGFVMSPKKINQIQEKYHFFTEETSDIIWSFNTKSMLFTFINSAIKSVLNYNPKEIINKPVSNLFFNESLNILKKELPFLIDDYKVNYLKGKLKLNKFGLISKSGSIILTETNIKLLKDEKGEIEVLGISKNIPERKESADALQVDDNKFKNLFEKMLLGVAYQSADGKIISANPAAEKILGISLKKMQSLSSTSPNWNSIREDGSPFPGNEHPAMLSLKTGKEIKNVIMGIKKPKNKEYTWINISAVPQFMDGEVKPYQVFTTFYDITEQKRIEDEIRILVEIIDTAPASITVHDLNGYFFYVNQTTLDMHGYTKEEYYAKNLHDIDTKESEKLIEPRIKTLLKTGESSFEVNHYRKDNSIFPLNVHVKVTEWRGKKVLLSVATDITEWKKAEEEISVYNKQVKILRDIYKEIISSRNTNEIVQNVLRGLKEIISCNHISIYLFDKITGKITVHIPDSDNKTISDYVREFIPSIDWINQLSNGKILYFNETQIKKASDPFLKKIINHKIITIIQVPMIVYGGIVGNLNLGNDNKEFFTDNYKELIIDIANVLAVAIYQYRLFEEIELNKLELEEHVKERTKELERTNKELESFSYSVSHDFRAPLRAINGFSKILLDDYYENLKDEGKTYLNNICLSTNKMGNLIDDLLKLSRISRTEVSFIQVNLSKIAESISYDLKASQRERKVDFIIKKELTAYADPSLIRIMIENLLRNSWKFTSKHSKAKIEFGSKEENKETVFFIRDDGVGFDMKYADKLFGAFQRLHSDKEFEGNGIGLSIVQRIINRHNGSIWVDAKVDKGATFYFILPKK